MSHFQIASILSVLALSLYQPLFCSEFLSTSKEPDTQSSIALSNEAQAVLCYFNDVIKSRGQKLFANIPDAEDLKGWEKRFQSEEESLQAFNSEVVQKLSPTLTKTKIGDVSVLEVRPKDWKDDKRVIVYLHGGSFTLNSAETQKIGSVPLATISGLRILVIDYPRAPFAKQPFILEQIISVFRELLDKGYLMKDIGIYGDSAGGNLAVAAILKMQAEGIDLPGALVLWSPWLDLTGSGDTYKTLEVDDPILSDDALKKCALAYAPVEDHKEPLVSPLFGDFASPMPPTLIQYATKEMLASDAIRFYDKLKTAGQNITISRYEGMWHAFQAFCWALPESQNALIETSKFFYRYLGVHNK